MQAIKQMHLNSLNLTQDVQPMQRDEWRGVGLALEMNEYVK
jgi:hypothetical protein